MKKLSLFVLMTLCSVSTWAVDVIITAKSEKIEANIIEVSSTEIKYKKASNPNGPSFVLSTDEISSILYDNGEVQVFEKKAQPAQQVQAQPAYSAPANAGMYQPNPYAYNSPQTPNDGYIVKIGKMYTYQGTTMDRKAYLRFLQGSCPTAFDYYKRNLYLESAGWGLFAAGIALAFPVAMPLWFGEADMPGLGVSLFSAGIGLAAGSSVMIAVGHVRRNRSHEVFNMYCSRPRTAANNTISLCAGQNRIGFALSF